MRWMGMVLLLLLSPSQARGEADRCTYHHRGSGELDGGAIFTDLWSHGCTTMTFVLYKYGPEGELSFSHSPCEAYSLPLWASGNAWYYQASWGQWKQQFQLSPGAFWIGRDTTQVSTTTLWCGQRDHPVPWPGSSTQQSHPSESAEMQGANQQLAAQQKLPSSTSHPMPDIHLPVVRLPEFHLNYLYLTLGACFLVGLTAVVIIARLGPNVAVLREDIERLHIKKVESDSWSDAWSAHELAALPDGSVDTTKILQEWRIKSSAHTYHQLQRKAKQAVKYLSEEYEEVYDMLVKENEEDIKRWTLITGKERPPWGIFQPKRKR